MSGTIISDKYGNIKKVRDKDNSINLIPNVSDKKINISNRPSSIDSIFGIYNKNKTDKKIEDKKLHTCKKGSSYSQEKEDGGLWLYIGTYKIRINFCPYCGYRAKGQ